MVLSSQLQEKGEMHEELQKLFSQNKRKREELYTPKTFTKV